MKIVGRIIAVAMSFAVVAGGGHVLLMKARPHTPIAVRDPSVPQPPPAETPKPSPVPSAPPVSAPPVQAPSPAPERPATGKLIEVSIDGQELIAWQDGRVVHRFVISTGKAGYETPKGRWKIHTKYENRWSRKWKVWMPYAMFWHPKYGYAFHELPYKPGQPQKRIGASKLGLADSHGCVRVNLGDARTLYEWAPVGTPVWVH